MFINNVIKFRAIRFHITKYIDYFNDIRISITNIKVRKSTKNNLYMQINSQYFVILSLHPPEWVE